MTEEQYLAAKKTVSDLEQRLLEMGASRARPLLAAANTNYMGAELMRLRAEIAAYEQEKGLNADNSERST